MASISLYANQFVELGFSMFIARAFTPEMIGIFAIAIGLTMVSSEVRLLGVGDYLIRTKDLQKNQIRASLGLTIIISWGIGLIIILGAGPLASFYKHDDIEELLYILVLGFFLTPFISINTSLLMKEFRFGSSIAIDWIGLITNIAITVYLYYQDYEHFALAIGTSAGVLAKFLVGTLIVSKQMSWLPRFRGFGEQVKFGTIVSLCGLADKAQIMSFDLILGRIGTTREVAVMSKALSGGYLVSHMLVTGAQRVAYPYLSQLDRNDVTEAFLKSTLLVSAICIPVLCSLALIGPQLVYVLFGPQWNESGSLLTIIAIWCVFKNAFPFFNSLLYVLEKEKIYLTVQVFSLILTVLAIILGFNWGLKGIAYAMIVVGFIEVSLVILIISIFIDRSIVEIICYLKPTVYLSVFCIVASYLFVIGVESLTGNQYVQLALFGVGMIVVWLSLLRVLKHPVCDELARIPVVGKLYQNL